MDGVLYRGSEVLPGVKELLDALTLRERPGTRRQSIAAQIARANTVSLREVPSGAGLARLGIERPIREEEERPAAAAIAHEGRGHAGHH